MMREILQNILFPDNSMSEYWELFYRGRRGRLSGSGKDRCLFVGEDSYLEFNTYLNGLSFSKWKKYTGVEKVRLSLEMEGKADIILCGHTLGQDVAVRNELHKQSVDCKERKKVFFDFPENDETILSFEIFTESEIKLYGGCYEGVFSENEKQEVELAVALAAFKDKELVCANIDRLEKELFCCDAEVSGHTTVHIVDNGLGISEKDVPERKVFFLHRNPISGRAGCFARGMIECLRQKPKATHILLLDGASIVSVESILRMYELLSHLRNEYRDCFVGGALLKLGEKNIQEEDIGAIANGFDATPLKKIWNHYSLWENMQNEKEYERDNMYQSWRYCCIPAGVIRQNGLPLPLYEHMEDVEYSLRCNARIISMNGIFIWHKGSYDRYDSYEEVYLKFRNVLICKATEGIPAAGDSLARLKTDFRTLLLKHDYSGAELLLCAFEDYMKGPRILLDRDGEVLLSDRKTLKEPDFAYEEAGEERRYLDRDPREWIEHSAFEKKVYWRTVGGHILLPEALLDKEPTVIPFGWENAPWRLELKKTYIAIDPLNRRYQIRKIDKKRFYSLMLRFANDLLYHKKNARRIRLAYETKRDYLISERFWRKYLSMESEEPV